jgi:hypothetical protein
VNSKEKYTVCSVEIMISFVKNRFLFAVNEYENEQSYKNAATFGNCSYFALYTGIYTLTLHKW